MYASLINGFNASLNPNTLDFYRLGIDTDLANLVADCYPYANDFNKHHIMDKLFMLKTITKSVAINMSVDYNMNICNTCNLVYVYLDDVIKSPVVVKTYFRGLDTIIVYRKSGMLIDNIETDEELKELIIQLYEEVKHTVGFISEIPSISNIHKYYGWNDMKSAMIYLSPFIIWFSIIGKNVTNDEDIDKLINTIIEVDFNDYYFDLLKDVAKGIKMHSLNSIFEHGALCRIIRDYSLREKVKNENDN